MTFVSIKRVYIGLWIAALAIVGLWALLMLFGVREDSVLRLVPVSIGLSAVLNGIAGFTHELMVARSGATMRLQEEAPSRRRIWPAASIVIGLVFVFGGIFGS